MASRRKDVDDSHVAVKKPQKMGVSVKFHPSISSRVASMLTLLLRLPCYACA